VSGRSSSRHDSIIWNVITGTGAVIAYSHGLLLTCAGIQSSGSRPAVQVDSPGGGADRERRPVADLR
jgi:hypothetical protein